MTPVDDALHLHGSNASKSANLSSPFYGHALAGLNGGPELHGVLSFHGDWRGSTLFILL